jgi:hypothetical protein
VRGSEFRRIAEGLQRGSGEVEIGRYFTPDEIDTAREAMTQLALPTRDLGPIVGYFDIQRSALAVEPLVLQGPRLVQPAFGQIGFGVEYEVVRGFGNPLVRVEDILGLVRLP